MNQKIKFQAPQNPIKTHITTFLTGFIQVFFVGLSTYAISKQWIEMQWATAYFIGIVWTHNVKKTNTASESLCQSYSIGSAFGSIASTYLIKFIFKFFSDLF